MKWIKEEILLHWIFAWSVFDPNFAGGVTYQSCVAGCSCCVDKICGPAHGVPDACIYGCIDGHRGARCDDLCTHNCTSCSNDANTCETCYDGFYLGVNKDCQSECPVNCKNNVCDSLSGACDECMTNYYGESCDLTCPENCKDSQTNARRCVSASGACIFGCKDGFFGLRCNEECSSLCVDSVCTQEEGICVNGCTGPYYNPVCVSSSEKPQGEPDNTLAVVAIAVLATILAVASTALCMLVLKTIVEKLRSTDRQIDESMSQVQYEHSEVGEGAIQTENQTVVSEEDIIGYESLNRTQAQEHTYDTAKRNVTKSKYRSYNIHTKSMHFPIPTSESSLETYACK
ncbi:multiple epidermal growth factor-like domains protein 10 [Mercenaria mercenaria]|uniref:multiple epidermal growth factor-like domains protein 10 n=1 Tax=Mercenaria mercenaria TaxID=6596 RepID=UPI00234E9A0F|nr:multiple epidermal growth factor-like domains protein 10 [Mercenaria mercenaria]